MKNKIIFVSVLTLLLSSGFFFNKLYYEASTAPITNFDSIKNVTDMMAEPSSDGIITLSSVYTSSDIQRAVNNNTSYVDAEKEQTLSDADKAIIEEIREKSIAEANRVAATRAVENLSSSQKTEKYNDTIIKINELEADSETPKYGPEDPGIIPPERIPEQFTFDPSVDPATYKLLYTAYENIQNLYGPRSNSKIIKVFLDPYINGDYYSPALNEIHFGGVRIYGDWVIVHELTHAFHGEFCGPTNLWEEGLATVIANILDDSYQDDTYSETINLPFINFAYFDPYRWGAMTYYQLYLEDINFFKKYNELYYQRSRLDGQLNNLDAINISATVTPRIENEPTLQWFSHQYNYIPKSRTLDESENESAFMTQPERLLSGDFLIGLQYNTLVNSVSLKIYDNKNNLLSTYGRLLSHLAQGYDDIFFIDKKELLNYGNNEDLFKYEGALKFVITVNGNEAKQFIQYFPKVTTLNSNISIAGSVIGPGDSVSVVNLDTSKSVNANISNNMFLINDTEFKKQGRYRVDVYQNQSYGCIGTVVDRSAAATSLATTSATKCIYTKKVKIASHYINKNDSSYNLNPYITQIQTAGDTCKLKILNTKSFNRSININTQTQNYCGQVLSLNGMPIERSWGIQNTYNISNLEKSTQYQYKINYTDLVKQYSKNGSITTLNNPDLIITDIKNTGDPSQQNFVRTYTFNQPISPDSIKNIKLWLGDRMGWLEPDIVKVYIVGQSLNIRSPYMYNNADYYITGLDEITDLSGNPLYEFNYDVSNFHTPLSPGSINPPEYKLTKDTFSENDGISLTTNFQSKNLTAEKIELIRSNAKKEGCDDDSGMGGETDCFLAVSETTIGPNAIKTIIKEPILYNSYYYLIISSVVDDKNNYVQSQTFQLLSSPMPGTEAPKIVSYEPTYEGDLFKKITVHFNNNLSLENLGLLNFYTPSGLLNGSSTNKLTALVSGNILTLTPNEAFYKKGFYSLYLNESKDILGNYLTNCDVYFSNP